MDRFKKELLDTYRTYSVWDMRRIAKLQKNGYEKYWIWRNLILKYVENNLDWNWKIDLLATNPLFHMIDRSPCISCYVLQWKSNLEAWLLNDPRTRKTLITRSNLVSQSYITNHMRLEFSYPDSVLILWKLWFLQELIDESLQDILDILNGWLKFN